jgi:hypothetical protein
MTTKVIISLDRNKFKKRKLKRSKLINLPKYSCTLEQDVEQACDGVVSCLEDANVYLGTPFTVLFSGFGR